ncbi:hypothetical protein OSB04_005213 [Centaurea solstitialis]|uniref:Dof-type domain-containing protein n=1 Tax=Centaurea solstitialis TaxID=347529 RepID=A0AA38TFK1_9ASTR|nr:hypothetical protein OSB04_005213 [Centaurea solstitialis]
MEATGIKLFGKNISYSDTNRPRFSTAIDAQSSGRGYDEHGGRKHGDELRTDETCLKEEDSKRERIHEVFLNLIINLKHFQDQLRENKQENSSSPKVISESDGNPEPPITEDTDAAKAETLDDSTNSQPNDLKKPDKTIPCIRCNSMDTKFCYYNNYNVKQPRHFCKSCQRYWTAGGTTRNMAVGAGRRKNKNPASHYGFLTISQSAQIETSNASNGVHGVSPKVISFGSISPNVDSGRISAVSDDCSSGSTVTTSNSVAEKMQDGNGFHSQVPCIPGISWSYNPWNSAIPIPTVCPAGYPSMPMPFYPSPYWNYIPWLPNQNMQPSSDLNSFILGKRSREAESISPNGSEEPKKQKSSVLIPKTLRINDPDEAAKSSIWSTLGIKNESLGTQGLFNAFQTKNEESINYPVLHVNPAALSRSLCFQERA